MQNNNIKLHHYQKKLLHKLSKGKSHKFNDLLIDGLESEHMNYHLKQLINLKFAEKVNDRYQLTDIGKDYRNMMDDEVKIIEKQPKTSILIKGVRKREGTNEIEHLLSRRLIQPYLGKVGRLGGKVRFGETLEEAVRRELYEETGLKAETITLEEIYRKMRYREDGTYIQDVIFYIYHATNFTGKMIKKTEHQENLWATAKETEKLNMYDNLTLSNKLEPKEFRISEDVGLAEDY